MNEASYNCCSSAKSGRKGICSTEQSVCLDCASRIHVQPAGANALSPVGRSNREIKTRIQKQRGFASGAWSRAAPRRVRRAQSSELSIRTQESAQKCGSSEKEVGYAVNCALHVFARRKRICRAHVQVQTLMHRGCSTHAAASSSDKETSRTARRAGK